MLIWRFEAVFMTIDSTSTDGTDKKQKRLRKYAEKLSESTLSD